MHTVGTPCSGSGTSGIGGRHSTRNVVVTDSGAWAVQSRQVRSSANACCAGKNIAPPFTSAYGSRPISTAVTIA